MKLNANKITSIFLRLISSIFPFFLRIFRVSSITIFAIIFNNFIVSTKYVCNHFVYVGDENSYLDQERRIRFPV